MYAFSCVFVFNNANLIQKKACVKFFVKLIFESSKQRGIDMKKPYYYNSSYKPYRYTSPRRLSKGSKLCISAIIACLLIMIFIMSSAMSYEDRQNSIEEYCSMVNSGYWPAFNKSIDCGVQ